MKSETVHLLADDEIISQISTGLAADGISMAEPESATSLVDGLDSPLGPHEIQEILQFLTVAFKTGAAALVFFDRLVAILRKRDGSPAVKLIGANGKLIGTITAASSADAVVQMLGFPGASNSPV